MKNENIKYGGFWIRFIAFIIDSLIIMLIEGVLVLPLLGLMGYNIAFLPTLDELNNADPEVLISVLVSLGTGIYLSIFVITWLYFSLLQSGPRQASIGKMAVGLKIIDEYGVRISFGRASLRYFSRYISTAVLMIGYIMTGFTPKKQALHDIIAHTYVVKL